MTSSDLWDEDTAERYDDISAEMFAPQVLGPAVDFLVRLAGSGSALEFAIGTGRVAIPLAARGISVTGIELSQPMVNRLRRKVPAEQLPVVIGDMAATTVPREFSLVSVVWNSIGNLCTQDEQVRCFRNAARLDAGKRVADWEGAPFTSDSESHVSVWRKPLNAISVNMGSHGAPTPGG